MAREDIKTIVSGLINDTKNLMDEMFTRIGIKPEFSITMDNSDWQHIRAVVKRMVQMGASPATVEVAAKFESLIDEQEKQLLQRVSEVLTPEENEKEIGGDSPHS